VWLTAGWEHSGEETAEGVAIEAEFEQADMLTRALDAGQHEPFAW